MMGSANVLLLLFLTLYLYFATSNSSNSGCVETERKALMDFKGSLVDELNQLSSWTGRNCCSWYGITCHDPTGFVQKIDLQGPALPGGDKYAVGGDINSSLLQLEHLEYLDLGGNDFSGIPIPAFLGSLGNLQYLGLWGAGFSGEIPQSLGNLSNLQTLELGEIQSFENKLLSSRSLEWITRLTSLTTLELYSTELSDAVDWLDSINMLSSLSSLTLYDCGLVDMALSRDLNLTSLVEIDLSFNSFGSSIPNSLCTLTALTRLDFTSSDLHGSIPSCFGNLTSLHLLNLRDNHLNGTIPSDLGSLTQLTYLFLDQNQLSGQIPSTLGKLTKLYNLDISHNSVTGELSESFFEELKSLIFLDFSRNQFITLNVSSQWIPPFQLEILGMDSVFIGTSFPAWLQTQTNLWRLNLRNTNISGVIPDWCQTSYPYLYFIDLSKNLLTGPIPTFNVINKATITDLRLSDNQFTAGNIPDALCSLHSLQSLELATNQLIGKIPSCLGNLQELRVLDLANNSLSDHIPYELGYLKYLVVLRLNGNKLFGELPSSFQNLTRLTTLDLGKNELEGFIPSWIGKEFISLEHLMLQSNRFSGEISANLCQLPSLHVLNLPDNSLVGTIPPCLGNLSMMLSNDYATSIYSYLDDDTVLGMIIKGIELEYSSNLKYAKFISLSENHLHGDIPDELMDLTWLQSLNLSNNELTGKIPRRIGNMKHLESLDLSRNRLSGAIPQSLADIDNLGYLNLSFNNLSGRIPSGPHFDTFADPSTYEGNGELCGKPAAKRCDDDDLVPSKQNGPVSEGDDDLFEIEWIYAGIGPGFAVGFLGVFCLLYFKSSWRYALFRFLENVYYSF